MAVVWAFRIGVALSGVLVRYCATSGCDYQAASNAVGRIYTDLFDPDADPAALTDRANEALGAPEGGVAAVTDFTGTFELRKLQWRLSRAPSARVEDVDVMTFHFLKVSGGVPTTWADGTDLPALETLVNNYWTAIAGRFPSFMHSDQFRWYRDGPAFYTLNSGGTAYVPIGDNPAVRVTEVDVAGTAAAAPWLPPQSAITITERTSSRKHWGRFYLPAIGSGSVTNDGLVAAATFTSLLGGAVTFYNAARAASMLPVVWSIQKPVRPKASGGTLPAVGAAAYEITSLQMDDIIDVIRSRRYQTGVTKTNTVLT